jgi:spermidine/putrescine transport system ATP-binding protein
MSDVIVVMRDGRIQQQGDPTELYERPTNRFVADFLGSSNFIPARVEGFDGSSHTATVRSERGLVMRGIVTDPAAILATGDPVTVATRPERLEVHVGGESAPDAAPGWTELAGRIHQGTYLGDHSEYRVHTDLAGELIVRRQNTVGAGGALGGGPGDAVVVRWHETANLILAG